MSDDFKKKNITVGMLVGFLSLGCMIFGPLAAMAGGWVSLSSRVTINETQIKGLEKTDDDLLKRIEAQKGDVAKRLDNIEAKLDRLLQRP
jgi:hypothetical protein